MSKTKYRMRISRLTVDKLGVRLYDKVSAVIAELVANSYDADATLVQISAPMGEYLATRKPGGAVNDKGLTIKVVDNGIGMTPQEINDFYLVVGAERRKDRKRGDVTKKYKRKVMGRKGVGKLAPFGICQKIEVISAGGNKIEGHDSSDLKVGYLTAHLILDRNDILKDEEYEYNPKPGKLDGTISKKTGTTVILHTFSYRLVPTMEEFNRQLAHRFGLQSPNWKIELTDSIKTSGAPNSKAMVGQFDIQLMPDTKITFNPGPNDEIDGKAVGPDAKVLPELSAGFSIDGRAYPICGWVGYARDPYKDDLMAGVRIYCRGKIATQTSVFNRGAGFHGEHTVRSYLVGQIHCDWLDEEEDLIQTDRRDILWSHEVGEAFQQWGQDVVKKIGTLSRGPLKQKTWDRFREFTRLDERIRKEFPLAEQANIREQALEIGRLFGQSVREDEITDPEKAEEVVQLTLMLAPVVTLDKKLREAAENSDSALAAVSEVLKLARIAELASFGKIADDRVRVIGRVEELKDDPDNLEEAFQQLLTGAPWLINPQWSPIVANQRFSTLRTEFEKFYKAKTGEDLRLDPFGEPKKRADFVMSSQDNAIQIIEIKKPKYKFAASDLDRLVIYKELMDEFLGKPGNEEFKKLFPEYHITLVCDAVNLSGTPRQGFENLVGIGVLTHITWEAFLLTTRKMHEDFLQEAERQKRHAIQKQTP